MGLFKRNKQATDRVQDLKNRVESLRKIDDEHRALTLDDFLAGDDAVTSRSEPRYTQPSTPPSPVIPHDDLEAELQRYLRTHADDETPEDADSTFDEVVAAPGFEQPAPRVDEPAGMRPISIDEFPPLPPLPDRPKDAPPASPPRLSADEEAALIAELQRYLKTDNVEGNEDVLGEPITTVEDPDEASEWQDTRLFDFPVQDTVLAAEASPDQSSDIGDDDVGPEPESGKLIELEGRIYEEPKPRRWPSVPRLLETEAATPHPPVPERIEHPRAVGDWEPL